MNQHLVQRYSMKQRMIGYVATGASVVAATLMLVAGPVGATVGVTPSNPVPVSPGQTSVPITVNWSGLPTSPALPLGRRIFITQCKKAPSDPTFQFGVDCSNLSEITLNPDQNPAGTGSGQFTAFHGVEPSGDETWGCFAPNETPPAGITAIPTCYIRVTQDTESNIADQQFTTLSFSLTNAVTPEVSSAILLPVTAAVIVAGAAFGITRRRRSAAAA